jgi:hypothetical protein
MSTVQLAKYHEAFELYRNFIAAFWQIPSLLLLVGTGLVGGSYELILQPLPRAILLGMGAGYTLFLVFAQYRNLLVRKKLASLLNALEEDMGLQAGYEGDHPLEPNFLEKVDVYRYFALFSWFIFVLLLALALSNLYVFLVSH